MLVFPTSTTVGMVVTTSQPIVGRWVGGLVQTEPCFAGEMSRTRGFGTGERAELAWLAWHILQWIGDIDMMMCRHSWSLLT